MCTAANHCLAWVHCSGCFSVTPFAVIYVHRVAVFLSELNDSWRLLSCTMCLSANMWSSISIIYIVLKCAVWTIIAFFYCMKVVGVFGCSLSVILERDEIIFHNFKRYIVIVSSSIWTCIKCTSVWCWLQVQWSPDYHWFVWYFFLCNCWKTDCQMWKGLLVNHC